MRNKPVIQLAKERVPIVPHFSTSFVFPLCFAIADLTPQKIIKQRIRTLTRQKTLKINIQINPFQFILY
jgi:hypothetical protein